MRVLLSFYVVSRVHATMPPYLRGGRKGREKKKKVIAGFLRVNNQKILKLTVSFISAERRGIDGSLHSKSTGTINRPQEKGEGNREPASLHHIVEKKKKKEGRLT